MVKLLIQTEWAGLLFWVGSLVLVVHPGRAAITAFHVVGAALSLAIPLYVSASATELPFRTVAVCGALGTVNGALGMAWCARNTARVSYLPMLLLTVAGLLGSAVLVFDAARPSRLF